MLTTGYYQYDIRKGYIDMKKRSLVFRRESVKLFSLSLFLIIFGLISMGVGNLQAGENSESNVSFLFAVFAITWVVFFAYVFYIRRRQADLEREIAELADLYAKTDNPK